MQLSFRQGLKKLEGVILRKKNCSSTPNSRSLASANFSGALFTTAYFQKNSAQISSLCNFHIINEGISSLMRLWLLMMLRIWYVRISARPKMHEPRIGCTRIIFQEGSWLLHYLNLEKVKTTVVKFA